MVCLLWEFHLLVDAHFQRVDCFRPGRWRYFVSPAILNLSRLERGSFPYIDHENWLIARKHRLTASNFGAVLAACKRNRYPSSLFKKLVEGYDLSTALAVQWGKEHEKIALETFTAASNEVEVVLSGFWVEASGFLGASPDGLCGDSAIVEVKCSYKFRNCSLTEALNKQPVLEVQ